MLTAQSRLDDVRTFVFWGSVIGVGLMTLPWIAVLGGSSDKPATAVLRSVLFLVGITLPVALGLLSRWVPKDPRTRRWLWLLCFAGVFLHGLGVYLTAIALVYLWAFFATRSTGGEATE